MAGSVDTNLFLGPVLWRQQPGIPFRDIKRIWYNNIDVVTVIVCNPPLDRPLLLYRRERITKTAYFDILYGLHRTFDEIAFIVRNGSRTTIINLNFYAITIRTICVVRDLPLAVCVQPFHDNTRKSCVICGRVFSRLRLCSTGEPCDTGSNVCERVGSYKI
jgi:hypothetical protein